MPVAQQPSQHHHHLFSAIGTFLHAFQPSSHHNNPNPSSSGIATPSVSGHGPSELPDLYQAFESQLAQRLSSLVPVEVSCSSVNLAFLKQLMGVVLATQLDLRTLVPTERNYIKSMEEFLERSIKLLDVCRGIEEQILEVESSQGMLHLVIFCLSSENGDLNQARVSRARRTLTQLILHMEVEREDQTDHVHSHRSFRGRLRERLSGHSGRESSHGNLGSASASSGHVNYVPAHVSSVPVLGNVAGLANHMAVPLLHGNHGAHGASGSAVHAGGNNSSQTLHTLELNLFPPRIPPKDEEEFFPAALYALNVLSIFSLGTICSALSSLGKSHSAGFIQPPHTALWAFPFLRLQDTVDEEFRKRSKQRGGYGGMWELEQISLLAKRLFELISVVEFLKMDDKKEEMKKVVKIFCQHVENLERDVGALHLQINEYYNRVAAARIGVLDMMSDVNG